MQVCVFPKIQNDKRKGEIQTKTTKEKKTKKNMYIIYKGCHQAKYLFRAWPFTG
jgi:hypothetical protein